jgi:hypothetical protein
VQAGLLAAAQHSSAARDACRDLMAIRPRDPLRITGVTVRGISGEWGAVRTVRCPDKGRSAPQAEDGPGRGAFCVLPGGLDGGALAVAGLLFAFGFAQGSWSERSRLVRVTRERSWQ